MLQRIIVNTHVRVKIEQDQANLSILSKVNKYNNLISILNIIY
jgi:hypothetical protein